MTDIKRFEFPGYGHLATNDTATHDVEIGAVNCDGIVVRLELIRKRMESFQLPFLIAKVSTADGKTPLWTFKGEGWNGIGMLAQAGDTPVIALINAGRNGSVAEIITLSDIARGARSSDILELFELKKKAAEFLGRDFDTSLKENRVIGILVQERKAQEAAERQAEREARERKQKERLELFKKRPTIIGFTATGQKRYGTPVTKGEWATLENGAFCMLVEAYDDKMQTHQGLIESFRVVKEGGKNPKKAGLALVTQEMPENVIGAPRTVKPVAEALVRKDGKFLDVKVYGSDDDVVLLQKAGLNGGTLVGVKQAGGDIALRQVFEDKIVKIAGAYAPQ